MGLCTALLVLGTWPLWWATSSFPIIPLCSLNVAIPITCDRLATGTMLAGIAFWCAAPLMNLATRQSGVTNRTSHVPTIGSWLYLIGFMVNAALNIHRIQPWAWQFAIIALLTRLAPPTVRLKSIRWLTISLYLFSAISKFDVNFVDGVGQELLSGLFSAIDFNDRFLTESTRRAFIWSLPLGELLVGLLLMRRPWWRLGLPLSLILHIVLLLTFSPWGLNHSWGVLLWNVYFLGQNLLVFTGGEHPAPPDQNNPIRLSLRTAILLLPVLNWFGWWDHWPSWSLYSERYADVTIEIQADSRHKLSENLQQYLRDPSVEGWSRLAYEQWSLKTTGAPGYPAARFDLGIARYLAAESQLDREIRVNFATPPNRWDSSREFHVARGRDQIQSLTEQFLLNSTPRLTVP